MRTGSYWLIILVAGFLYCFSQQCLAQDRKPASFYTDSLSQNNAAKENCSTDFLLNQLRKDPVYLAREKKMNEDILRALTQTIKKDGGAGTSADPYILPVVFHIINTNPASVTDLQVANAVKDLNDAFSKGGAYSASTGADTKIRFALAQTHPDGGITTGITRTTSFYYDNMNMNLEDARMKNLVQWDPVKYINIWVVRNIIGEISASFSCGVWTKMNAGGYATLPAGVNTSSATDGIVVAGFSGTVLAHEMGHYLGLYHTFEGNCTNNDCTKDGDRVCDTPPDGTTMGAANCAAPNNSCTTDTLSAYSNGFFPVDVPDQISNFMDYNNGSCTNQFTEGQATRMRAAIATQRSGLINNLMNKPCNGSNVIASFTRNNADPKVNDLIDFTNTSQNAVSYEWLIDDTVRDITTNFTNISFTTAKKHKISLRASGGGCTSTFSDFILVNCGVTARFWSNTQTIASKAGVFDDSILFINNSVGANSYQWIMSNNNGTGRNTVSSNAAGGGVNDLSYIFGQPGTYFVKLIATDGTCIDSTSSLNIQVIDPTPNAIVSMYAATCYQQTKVRLNVYACNLGYKTIAPGLPISFYDADPRKTGANKIDTTFLIPVGIKGICCGTAYQLTLDIKRPGINLIYAVVNDTGNAIPIALPNTVLKETTYADNVSSITNFRFKAVITPSVATIRAGDSLQLSVQTSPDPTSSSKFLWNTSKQLSCSTCATPMFYADSSRVKQVYATSQYQCFDTTATTLTVIQLDDYAIQINSVSCGGPDSLAVSVTVNSKPGGPGIPKNLPISIYRNNPSTAGAQLLLPSFTVPDSVTVQQKTYTFKIKKTTAGNLYATVNSNATAVPVSFTNAPFFENAFANNISAPYAYQPITKIIDTTICTGDTVLGHTVSGTYTDVFVIAGGCDSTRILNLTVRAAAVTKTNINVAICAGQNYAGYAQAGTYIDVFKGVNSCDSIRTLNLIVNPVVRRTNSVQICKGNSYQAAGKLQTKSGTYVDTFKTTVGCDSIITTLLTVNPVPVNFLPLDTFICISQTLPITLSYPTVNWSDGSIGKSFIVTQPGIYGAQVIDNNGCTGTDSIKVIFTKCIPIQIPDAFTPNNDGKNDIFKPLIGAPITNYNMQIWNRWGQKIFETRRYNEGWNGTWLGEQQQNGVYVYFFSFTDLDGSAVVRKGTLVLIR